MTTSKEMEYAVKMCQRKNRGMQENGSCHENDRKRKMTH
ncbi:hypothetical protein JOC86_002035 [Bacillus pakistanensis]|uniref:Uncharacterized protein n=1 Tax=Rossellomorea pakistanensis TaxID=992288 RepID=A0ABS2NCC7_9BACI|nr:hypothetical protein [Bacillus pakistanensis]